MVAAIVSNSPSAGIGTGGLFRRKMLKDLCVATDVAEQVDDAEVFKFKPVRLSRQSAGKAVGSDFAKQLIDFDLGPVKLVRQRCRDLLGVRYA